MITFCLLFFGIVFLYTGDLAFDYSPAAAAGAAIIGLFLLARPAMEGYRFLRANYFPPSLNKKVPKRKPHLRVVEPKDKKPTIH